MVTANLIVDKNNEKKIKISVIDTGIGIEEEDFDKVFQLFKTTDDALNINKSSSHGFGLYTCQKLSLKLAANISEGL